MTSSHRVFVIHIFAESHVDEHFDSAGLRRISLSSANLEYVNELWAYVGGLS